jgi:hypothetical protein
MAPKGSPRDMNEWRATLRDPDITFPGESSELLVYLLSPSGTKA